MAKQVAKKAAAVKAEAKKPAAKSMKQRAQANSRKAVTNVTKATPPAKTPKASKAKAGGRPVIVLNASETKETAKTLFGRADKKRWSEMLRDTGLTTGKVKTMLNRLEAAKAVKQVSRGLYARV
jgi:hypothetical protein